jgi:hypothetical protein
MALAMSNFAQLFIEFGSEEATRKAIASKVTRQELDMMIKFGLDDGDGTIDRSEFILLCAVRIGALSPDLIQLINNRFSLLDVSKDGTLTYAEILEDQCKETEDVQKQENISADVPFDNKVLPDATAPNADETNNQHKISNVAASKNKVLPALIIRPGELTKTAMKPNSDQAV